MVLFLNLLCSWMIWQEVRQFWSLAVAPAILNEIQKHQKSWSNTVGRYFPLKRYPPLFIPQKGSYSPLGRRLPALRPAEPSKWPPLAKKLSGLKNLAALEGTNPNPTCLLMERKTPSSFNPLEGKSATKIDCVLFWYWALILFKITCNMPNPSQSPNDPPTCKWIVDRVLPDFSIWKIEFIQISFDTVVRTSDKKLMRVGFIIIVVVTCV